MAGATRFATTRKSRWSSPVKGDRQSGEELAQQVVQAETRKSRIRDGVELRALSREPILRTLALRLTLHRRGQRCDEDRGGYRSGAIDQPPRGQHQRMRPDT